MLNRRTFTAAAALSLLAPAAAPAGITTPADADAPLFDLCRRWRETKALRERGEKQAEEMNGNLPGINWTTEEMKAHGIDLNPETTRWVQLKHIEDADKKDSPRRRKITYEEHEEGNVLTCIQTLTRPTNVSDEEIAAWKQRCAARRALYDAKQEARERAYEASGIDALLDHVDEIYDEEDRLWQEAMSMQPVTLAGAVEKLRMYREGDEEAFDVEHKALSSQKLMFLAVLNDLEKMAGVETAPAQPTQVREGGAA